VRFNLFQAAALPEVSDSSAFPFDDATMISKRQFTHVGYQLDATITVACTL
jgi:hypothetical protein